MTVPDILALDFDGVLCEGSREYFETSRRTYARVWPHAPGPGAERFEAFRALRPVIETGWEMPLLLRAIEGRSWLFVISVGAVSAAIVYLVFNTLLGTVLPRSPFGF